MWIKPAYSKDPQFTRSVNMADDALNWSFLTDDDDLESKQRFNEAAASSHIDI